jgi:glycosyltransferase involved in cell wall biosynthesis
LAAWDHTARFSVVIVTKARPEPLRRALLSVARELPDDGEVIIVDGDQMRTAEPPVRELQERFPGLDVRYIASRPGVTLQRNVGIDAARGDVVLFIDDDCRLERGIFEVLACAYRDRAVVGVTGRVERRPRDRLGPESHSRLRWLLVGAGRQGTMNSYGLRRPIVNVAKARDVEYMFGAFMSARRYVAASVRFDETLNGYSLGEDDDFSYRLSRRGRVRYEPAAAVFHDELGFAGMDRAQMDRIRVVNRAYLFRKNFPQTRRAKARFAVLMAMLCVHRVLNREWSGVRGLLGGMREVRRTRSPRTHLTPGAALLQPLASVRLASSMHLALVFAAGLLISIGIDYFFEPW